MFAHCLGASSLPRLTITSGELVGGSGGGARREWVWSIGGSIAENGVNRDSASQIEACRRELRECLPWLDLRDARFATCRWDRAEGVVKRSTPPKRPDDPTIVRAGEGDGPGGNVIVGWPTKLAFAPAFAHRVAALIKDMGVEPGGSWGVPAEPMLPIAAVAPRPWEGVQWT